MSSEQTFVDVLQSWAATRPEHTALTFLEDGESPADILTYRLLDERARRIASGVRKVVQAGDRVLLLHPAGLEFAAAFLGCLYAGVVPVAAYPPRNPRHVARIEAILADADARCVLTQTNFKERLAAWLSHRAGDLPLICSDDMNDDPAGWRPDISTTLDTLAFLQYTSGSTGQPKGVMVTHGNLMSNERMIARATGLPDGFVMVSWLPIYHDMGLIGSLMQPLFLGGHCIFMSPAAFLQKPRRWLAAISTFRAQCSGGPNFAFRLCTRMIQQDQKDSLDLSSLKVLFCGSEPINATDLEQFADAFGECGLRRQALYCCYGMAESTLMATGSKPGTGPLTEVLDADALALNIARVANADSVPRVVVGCGQAVEGEDVVVVDENHRALPDGQVGEIWLRGPNIGRGYWQQPTRTHETFAAHLDGSSADDGAFLRTGDLGFLRNGELFVTGRIKDLIIIRGRNHYPHDIEFTVQHSHDAFRGAGAAFSVTVEGEERLVVVQEIDRHRHHEAEEAVPLLRAAIVDEYEITPYAVVLVRQNAVPKTSSGKIQRAACAKAYLDGNIATVYEWKDAGVVGIKEPAQFVEPRSREDIEDFLLLKLANGLAISPDQIDISQPFSSFGLDSLRTLALLDEVETWLGRSLSPTLFWDYPTVTDLAAHLAEGIPAANTGETRG
jgi:acyl-CoA synthetase (AMP-forming)/AMP-acid ligase II/acyl carrier protein